MELNAYRSEMEEELRAILGYWMKHTIDGKYGGFLGQIGADGTPWPEAPKGLVMNSRILWAFSAAFNHGSERAYLVPARRAFQYLLRHFIDHEYGGVRWSVDHTGAPLDERKQIYGLAFCIYGLSEYWLAEKDPLALEEAIGLYRLIEKYSFDAKSGGYFEAFTRDWRPIADLRLSEKDANEKKTMNTHLHVLEAYANLYRAWPDPSLKQQIGRLLGNFSEHIVDKHTGHLRLFFDEDWTLRSSIVSYGHDIEAAWLLQEAAWVTGEKDWIAGAREQAVKISQAVAEGLDADGGLWYELEPAGLVREKHSWPQAEAMVGFFNAWQLGGGDWLEKSEAAWGFVKKYIKDRVHGEWHWGVREDHSPMPGQDKAGFWKCPYHNSRACLEIIKRIDALK